MKGSIMVAKVTCCVTVNGHNS